MDKILLYVNILEFENFIKENTSGIKQISKIVETLNSQDNLKFQATILSNKILVFNKNEEDTKLAHTSSLVTYAQQLFHSLSAINLTSIGIITNGKGDFTEIKSTNLTPCTIQLSVNSNDFDSLLTLIEAYNDEIKIDGSVLFINKDLDSSTLSTMNCNDKYNIVLPPSSLVEIPPSIFISLKNEPLVFSDFFVDNFFEEEEEEEEEEEDNNNFFNEVIENQFIIIELDEARSLVTGKINWVAKANMVNYSDDGILRSFSYTPYVCDGTETFIFDGKFEKYLFYLFHQRKPIKINTKDCALVKLENYFATMVQNISDYESYNKFCELPIECQTCKLISPRCKKCEYMSCCLRCEYRNRCN